MCMYRVCNFRVYLIVTATVIVIATAQALQSYACAVHSCNFLNKQVK